MIARATLLAALIVYLVHMTYTTLYFSQEYESRTSSRPSLTLSISECEADEVVPELDEEDRFNIYRRVDGPQLHVYTLVYNEEMMLPYFLDYYIREGATRIVIYNHGSTDRSVEIVQSYAQWGVELRHWTASVDDELPAVEHTKLKNEMWKEVRQEAALREKELGASQACARTYAIVSDVDEFVWVEGGLVPYLERQCVAGRTLFPSNGFNMISAVPLVEGACLPAQVRMGTASNAYGKTLMFDVLRINEINYDLGAHHADAQGEVVVTPDDEKVTMLHFKYVTSPEHMAHHILVNRFERTKSNRKIGHSLYYDVGRDDILCKYQSLLTQTNTLVVTSTPAWCDVRHSSVTSDHLAKPFLSHHNPGLFWDQKADADVASRCEARCAAACPRGIVHCECDAQSGATQAQCASHRPDLDLHCAAIQEQLSANGASITP